MKAHVLSRQEMTRRVGRAQRTHQDTISRVSVKAVNTVVMMPMPRVTAKPRTGPVPMKNSTAETAAAFGFPACSAGYGYSFEPVPTDIEVGTGGWLYVTSLPGGPEDPSLGARGSVLKIHPGTGEVRTVAKGLISATGLAVDRFTGTIAVTELFGGPQGTGRVALITDAMSAAGSADGDYLLGELAVTVSDGVAVLAGTDTIAGSTLTQDAALRLALTGAEQSPMCAVEALTTVPAKALGEDDRIGLLAPGYVADAVAWTDDWHVSRVWAAGRELTGGR